MLAGTSEEAKQSEAGKKMRLRGAIVEPKDGGRHCKARAAASVRLLTALLLFMLAMSPGARGQNATEPSASGGSQHGVTWDFSGLVAEGGTWQMRVTTSARAYMPGDGLTMAIDFTINSVGLAYNIERVAGVYTLVTGIRAFDGEGKAIGRDHSMASTVLNSLGLPIEGETEGLPTDRFGGAFHHPIDSYVVTAPADLDIDTNNGTVTGTAVHGVLLDPEIPPGWYQLRIDIGLEITEGDLVTLWGVDPAGRSTTEEEQSYAVTSPIAIGTTTQPHMIWTLFSSSLPGGGIVALEDRGYMASSRHLGYSTMPILPMTDSHGGQIRYLIEPDFPLVWNPFMRTPSPSLDLDYHSGWMEVRIENPDGTIVDLGGAQFNGRRGIGATTLQDRFAYSFSSYGRHRIELTGWIKDQSNQTYVGGGVYEIWIAMPIEIETNVLPGTPFREDDFFDPGFRLYPPMPAAVEVTWKLDRYSRGDIASDTFTARANQWGHYSPPLVAGRDRFARATRIRFSDPGEYMVTFRATYREEDGTLWMGEKVVAGIALPNEVINLASRPPASSSFAITTDARYAPVPADTGDTILLPVSTTPGLPMVPTFPVGFFLGEQSGFRTDDAALKVLDSGSVGTFVTPALATSSGLYAHSYPEDIDRLAYLGAFASRNDGYGFARIGEGSADAHMPYPTFPWNRRELSPDGVGDVYHFWASMVYRDIAAGSVRYGYYSTGLVVTDDVTVPRIHQPGSRLIADGWGTRNLFMHNTAIRPGSILSEDDAFTAGAYFLPLPDESTIEFTVTAPDGQQHTIVAYGDNSGYACNLRDRVELDRTGVWKVNAALTQGDESGGILGVNIGDPWEFYVIESGNTRPIEFHMPFQAPLDPEEELLVLTGDLVGADIAEGTMYISTTFNGAIVEQTTRDIRDSAFVYSVDLAQVSQSFENYDPFDARDRLVISFYTIGLSGSGDRRTAAKVVYVQDGVLFTGEKQYSPIDPGTREERLREMSESAESDLAHELRGRVPAEGRE